MRRLGPEYKSDNAEQGWSDVTLQEWLNDAARELGEGLGVERFGERYPRAHALAALHLLTHAESGRRDQRQGDQGLRLTGALASAGTGGVTFTTRDLLSAAPPALRAKWGSTRFGEQLIALYMETEAGSASTTPFIVEPSF